MRVHLNKKFAPIGLILLFFGWILSNQDIYLSSDVFLSRDNAHTHLPSFANIVNQMRFQPGLPDWYFSKEGGVWMPTLSSLFTAIIPHRFAGYFLASATSFDINVAYKFSYLVIGHGLYLLGVYLLLKTLFQSVFWAAGILIAGFFTSNILSFYHQENSFSVVFFIPYLWYFYLKMAENPRWFVAFCATAGYSLNHFYPQLQICYWLFVFISLALTWKSNGHFLKGRWLSLKANPKLVALGALVFVLASLPATYSYSKYWDQIGSPLRQRDSKLAAGSYAELVSMQSKRCNLHPHNIGHYFGLTEFVEGSLDPHDTMSVYVGPALLLLVAVIFSFLLPSRRFFLLMVVFLAFLAAGFYGPLPRLLWFWVPGLKMFRQYYHFIELFNIHLTLLCALSIKEMAVVLERLRINKRIFLCGIVAWVGISNFQWSRTTLEKYRAFFKNTLVADDILVPRKFAPDEFARESLQEQNYPYESGVKTVKPAAVSHQLYQKAWESFGGVHLKGGRQRFIYNLEDLFVTSQDRSFKFNIHRAPGNPNSLEILQYNDGMWRATDLKGNPIPIVKGELGNISIPNIYSGMSVVVRRGASGWGYMVLVSFASLFFGVLYSALRLKKTDRSQARWRWLPAPTFSIKTHSL